MRPLPSVNGMVKTSGRVPPPRATVNVAAVQLYSSGTTVIEGYSAWTSLIWRFRASTASWRAPGRNTPTVIVTGLWSAAGAALLAALAAGALEALGTLVAALQAPSEMTAIAASAKVLSLRSGLRVISIPTSAHVRCSSGETSGGSTHLRGGGPVDISASSFLLLLSDTQPGRGVIRQVAGCDVGAGDQDHDMLRQGDCGAGQVRDRGEAGTASEGKHPVW